jgi:hypothetical protein
MSQPYTNGLHWAANDRLDLVSQMFHVEHFAFRLRQEGTQLPARGHPRPR